MALIFIYWVPLLAWMGIIFTLSSIPSLSTGLGIWDLILRKMAHVVEYAVLTVLFLRAFTQTWSHVHVRKLIIWSSVLAVLYAASDEFHQSFVPGRGPSLLDVLIDSVGVLLVGIFWSKKKNIFNSK